VGVKLGVGSGVALWLRLWLSLTLDDGDVVPDTDSLSDSLGLGLALGLRVALGVGSADRLGLSLCGVVVAVPMPTRRVQDAPPPSTPTAASCAWPTARSVSTTPTPAACRCFKGNRTLRLTLSCARSGVPRATVSTNSAEGRSGLGWHARHPNWMNAKLGVRDPGVARTCQDLRWSSPAGCIRKRDSYA
jgi:hypothetical protein